MKQACSTNTIKLEETSCIPKAFGFHPLIKNKFRPMQKLIPIIAIFFSFSGFANQLQDSIAAGNKAYADEQYKKAISRYEFVIKQGYQAPQLYYNLANAYFKDNEIAYAIYYYEKAKLLAPKDENINFNLELARSKTLDKIEAVPEIFYIRWWKSIRMMFTTDTWSKMAIFLIFHALFLLILYFVSPRSGLKKISFFTAISMFFMAILFFIFAYSSNKHQTNSKEAIIFATSVTAKSSPDEGSTDLFVLHEGTKVVVTDELSNWLEIKIADGSIGWVSNESLKKL